MIKPKGGPVTEAGKHNSSKNAIKHGATSGNFLSSSEQQSHLSFIQKLKKFYPSDNPLVAMQIERISRIKVQLDRIQNIIDSKFEATQSKFSFDPSSDEFLSLTKDEQFIYFLCNQNFDISERFANVFGDNIFTELPKIQLLNPQTSEDFLRIAPQFCESIFMLSLENNLDISSYTNQLLIEDAPDSPRSDINENFIHTILFDFDLRRATSQNIKPLEEVIRATPASILKDAATFMFAKALEYKALNTRLQAFEQYTLAQQKAMTPDLTEIDKLMRYQTALQRQLSSTMGELLALTRESV